MKRHARAAIAIAAIGLSTSAWAASAAQAAAPQFTGVALGRTDQSSAMLVARINPEGSAITACEFEYGPTDAYGQSAPCLANTHTEAPFVGKDGTTILPAAALLDGLEEATTYHYRLVVSNGDGDVEGDDQSFATETEPESCDTCAGAEGKRRIELVSDIDKEQNDVNYAKLSADGNRVLYLVGGGTPDSTFGNKSVFLADRTPTGWHSRNALPENPGIDPGSGYEEFFLTSPDLSVWAQGIWSSIFGDPPSPVTVVRVRDDNSQQVLHTFPDVDQTEIAAVPSVAASDDLSHIFFNTQEPIAATPPAGTGNVYDFGSGTPVLVSRLPGGSPPPCGVPVLSGLDGFARFYINSDVRQHWSSADGSHVFFQATPGSDCSAPQQLYRRNLGTGTTTLVSGPVVSGPDQGIAAPGLIQAAPDSSWVIYETASRLDPADTNSDPDIYRWDAAGETNTCLTCVVPDANVIASVESVVASEDGSHVYFLSKGQLTGDAPEGASAKLFVWRAGPGGGAVAYVAPSRRISPAASTTGSDLTRDGSTLVFANNEAGVTADNPAGLLEYFRYDDRDGSVVCMSCPASAATISVPMNLTAGRLPPDAGHVLSDDGESFVFQSFDSLLPADVNDDSDLYEWHSGHLGLISDGVAEERKVNLLEVSGNGRDVLFKAPGGSVFGAPDTTPQIFDARLGGGFPPPPVPPAPCAGEACKGAVPPAPATPSAVTPNFSGPLDPTPQRPGKGCGKGRHRVSQHGKSRCAKKKVRANHKRRARR